MARPCTQVCQSPGSKSSEFQANRCRVNGKWLIHAQDRNLQPLEFLLTAEDKGVCGREPKYIGQGL